MDVSIVLIANPIVGAKKGPFHIYGELGISPQATEEQILDALYVWLMDWFCVDESDEFTMIRFYEFVGDSYEHISLVNAYFSFHPEEIPTEDGKVNVVLFKNLLRYMSNGLDKHPVQFVNSLAKELDNIHRQALENSGFAINNTFSRRWRKFK